MKRAFILLLCAVLAVGACGCGADRTDSSAESLTAGVEPAGKGNSLSLFASSYGSSSKEESSSSAVSSKEASSVYSEPVSSYSDSTSSADTSSVYSSSVYSTSSKASTSSKTYSAASSKGASSVTSSKATSSKKSGPVTPISTQPNPTGLTSVDRKNNNGSNWELTLVNPWNTLHTSYSVELGSVDSRYSNGAHYFDKRAVKYLNAMCKAASKDGVNLIVISSYRTYDYQQMLYNNEIADYKARNPGCSNKEAKIGAATVVARPATSEHNLGLAVDFNSVEESFKYTAEYKWLQKHCTEYGFIMRYAKSKQSYTGVIYEPWHYRYVGKENAKKIAASGLSLEEWLLQNGG